MWNSQRLLTFHDFSKKILSSGFSFPLLGRIGGGEGGGVGESPTTEYLLILPSGKISPASSKVNSPPLNNNFHVLTQ